MKQKAVDGARIERLAYSPAEVAAACGLSRKAIYRAIEIGELRAAKVCSGRRLLITVEELRAWIDRTVERAAPAASRRVDDPAPRRALPGRRWGTRCGRSLRHEHPARTAQESRGVGGSLA